MKRCTLILSLVATLTLASSALAEDQPYGWTISSSNADPFANTMVATAQVETVYLWLACCDLPEELNQGMAAAEFDIVSTGTVHLASTAVNGFLNAGGNTNLLLAVGGCPCGPVVAAELLILAFPGSMCIAPSLANGIQGTVDCEPAPSLWGMDWIGLDLGLGECSQGEVCQKPVTVEDASWGSIKSLYR